MLIRSQTKMELVPLEKMVVTLNFLNIGEVVCFSPTSDDPDNYLTLGIYDSKERAVSVLNAIWEAYKKGENIFQMPEDALMTPRKVRKKQFPAGMFNVCPTCGKMLNDEKTCTNCGQAIDWSENVAEKTEEE